MTIRTYGPDGRKLGSCEEIVEAALGLQEPGSERPSLASEESRGLSHGTGVFWGAKGGFGWKRVLGKGELYHVVSNLARR